MEGSLLISKGIVIEVKKNYGIVLSDEGIYEKLVKKGSLSEGDRIIYTREDIYAARHAGHKKIYRTLVSAAMVIFAIAMALGFENLPSQNVYAVVSMDINPSIQYYLDKNDLVLRTEAMNEDGLDIVGCGLEGLSIEKAINRTLEEAEKTHYLKSDSKIIVSAVELKSGKLDYAEKIAEKIFVEPMIAQNKIEVFVLEVDRNDYEESRSMDTSLGKYKVYEIRGEDSSGSLEDINGMKASEIIEKDMLDEGKVHVFKNTEKDQQNEISNQSNNMKKTPEKTQKAETDEKTELTIMPGDENEKLSMEDLSKRGQNLEEVKKAETKNAKTAPLRNKETEDMPDSDYVEDVLMAENEKAAGKDEFAGLPENRNEKKVLPNSNNGNGTKLEKGDSVKAVEFDLEKKIEKQAKEKVAKNEDLGKPLNIADQENVETNSNSGNRVKFEKNASLKVAESDAASESEKQAKGRAVENNKDKASADEDLVSSSKDQARDESKPGKNSKTSDSTENKDEKSGNDKKFENDETERGKKEKLVAFKGKSDAKI